MINAKIPTLEGTLRPPKLYRGEKPTMAAPRTTEIETMYRVLIDKYYEDDLNQWPIQG